MLDYIICGTLSILAICGLTSVVWCYGIEKEGE